MGEDGDKDDAEAVDAVLSVLPFRRKGSEGRIYCGKAMTFACRLKNDMASSEAEDV